MKIEKLIIELEKIQRIYPESDIWIEDYINETTNIFDIEILVTNSEVETTIKMRR